MLRSVSAHVFQTWVIISILLASVCQPATAETSAPHGIKLLDGKRVMVLGDSITQGGTYVSFIEYILQKQYPDAAIDIVSVGLSSETTSGLSEEGHADGKFPRPCVHERLERALQAVKPTVVVACYGMNDGIYLPYSEERMQAFRDGMTRMVERCRAAGAEVILVTPPVYDNYKSKSDYDQVLAKFAEWEVQTPPPGVVAVADLHTLMAHDLAQRQQADPDFHFAKDGVHPGELGHLVMALSILKELHIKTAAGTADELLAIIQADPLWELVKKHRGMRSQGWLAHIGYKREKLVEPGTGNITDIEKDVAAIQHHINMIKR